MPFITVNRGGPEIPAEFVPGAYILVLTDITGPKTVTAQRGPKAGQDIDLLDWKFEIFDGPFAGLVVESSTSLASGPKSKIYSYLTALLGRPPATGQGFEKQDLVSQLALGTISIDDGGYLRIDNLSAMPATMLGQKVAEATGAPMTAPGAPGPVAAPVAVAAAPTPAPVPTPADALPF